MKAPTYIWVCHKCRKSNQPHTEKCASCGFPAIASAEDIEPSSQQDVTSAANNPWLFAPEGLIALFLVALTPFWAIQLLLKSYFLIAFILIALVVTFVYSFMWAMRKQRNEIAYIVMLCFLIGMWFVYQMYTP